MGRERFHFQFAPAPAGGLESVALSTHAPQRVRLEPYVPRLVPRDELVYLLHSTAEVEHALMVQYLYATFSLNPDNPLLTDDQKAAVTQWQDVILQIAREEMGHLACMQNLLLLLGGSVNFEREDFPFRSQLYPFHFRLEPLTLHSLAKYIAAERPDTIPDPATARLYEEEIEPLAREENDGAPVNRVGAVFERLLWLFRDPAGVPAGDPDPPVPDNALRPEAAPSLATAAEWSRGNDDVIVGPELTPGSTPAQARSAIREVLEQVAQQGEGYPSPAAGESHFDRFVGIWRGYRQWFPTSPSDDTGPGAPSRPVPVDPSTTSGSETTIAHPRSRAWAWLFNFRYRMLLGYLQHYFQYPAPDTNRDLLKSWTFREMYRSGQIAHKLMARPLRADDLPNRAGPPFELPYTLALPDRERDRWGAHRDVVEASLRLGEELARDEPPGPDKNYLTTLLNEDNQRRDRLTLLMGGQPIP